MLAQKVGFEVVLLCEHHFSRDFLPAQLLMCAALSSLGGRIRIGSGVLLLPLYNPVQVAEETATLDWISNGRFILGVGQGYRKSEFDAFCARKDRRGDLMEEYVQLIKRLWTEDNVTFEGEFYSCKNVSLRPKPKQKPRPEIWVGAKSQPAIARVSRIGDVWFADGISPIEVLARRLGDLGAGNRRTVRVAVARETFVSSSTDEAWASVETHLKEKYRTYYEWGQLQDENGSTIDPRTIEFDEVWGQVKSRFVVGSPERCIDMIARISEKLDATFFMANFRHTRMPEHLINESMRLFGGQVIPHFATDRHH